MAKRPKEFQFEIHLGLTLIVLVLVILNFGSHYTLFRVKRAVEADVRDGLYEAAVTSASYIQKGGREVLTESLLDDMRGDYDLETLEIVLLESERIDTSSGGQSVQPEFLEIDATLRADDLIPLLQNEPIYRHRSGDQLNAILFPVEYAGSKYVIGVARYSPLLSSLENAGRILLFTGLMGLLVIIYASLKLARYITSPFKHLKEKAEKSGLLEGSDSDEVSQLVQVYEKIIADLKNKEQELMRLNEIVSRRADDLEVYNNYILKSINAGIITLDSKNRLSTVNRAASQILGLRDDDLRDVEYEELFRDYPELGETVASFLTCDRPVENRRIQITGPEGRDIILGVSISSLTDSQGNSIGNSIILNDETEFIALQEELELKKRMALLGEMSGGLAHQLRNSVGAIVGFARLVHRRAGDDEIARQNADRLLTESEQAEALVARFLDFAKPLEIEFREFRPAELLDEIVTSFREKYGHVRFEMAFLNESSVRIPGDALLLKQALGNIVDNACKALGESGETVRLETELKENLFEIRIIDNGSGIPEDYKDKIFTPFFSGSPSGSGLGLALARKIILRHEGNIDFQSMVGEGTTFRVLLPMSRPARPTPEGLEHSLFAS
ncbi:MAG: PAS domain S-box protein [Candidatus Zixiibacteriota bacterium]|nr:MAG: PAS domain S-box protein [candidate division Zixibacteria bacterium]